MVFSRGPLAQRQGSPLFMPIHCQDNGSGGNSLQEKFVIICVYHYLTTADAIQPERLNAEGIRPFRSCCGAF